MSDVIYTGDDFLDKLLKGGISKNPAYNPKTKKGRSKSPILIDVSAGSLDGGNVNSMVDSERAIQFSPQQFGADQHRIDKDADMGIAYSPYNTEEELNQVRADKQSAFAQLNNAVVQAVGSEIVLGTALGLSDLVDFIANIGTKEGEDDYTNDVSSFIIDIQDSIRDRFEIYRENPNDSWDVGDFGWWAQNAISIASTASLLIPSKGVASGLSLAGKALRSATGIRAAKGIAKIISTAEKADKIADTIEMGAKIGTEALISRTAENYLEARGVYKEVYDDTLNKINNMSATQRDAFIKNNNLSSDMSNEELAKHIASVSADETFRNDYAMLLMDVAQFKAIEGMWKGVGSKTTTAAERIANRNAAKSLLTAGEKNADDVLEKTNWLARRKEAIKEMGRHPLTAIGSMELGEGFEEMYQGIQQEKGKEVAQIALNPNYTQRGLTSYLTDGHIWEQAFWGALGGVAFQGIGQGLNSAARKIKAHHDKKNMTEQEFELANMTAEKASIAEINGRNALITKFSEDMQMLNNRKNPNGFVIDPTTGQPKVVDGVKVNSDLTEEEAENLKQLTVSNFVANMAIRSTDLGTYDLLKDYIKSEELNKYFEKQGIAADANGRKLQDKMLEEMDRVNEDYTKAINDIYSNMSVDNHGTAKLVANSIVRHKFDLRELEISLDKAKSVVNKNLENGQNIDDYIEKARVRYVQNAIKELNDARNKIISAHEKNEISQQAHDQYLKDIDSKYKEVLDYAAANTTQGDLESVKTQLKKYTKEDDIAPIIAEFNEFAQGYTKSLDKENGKPSEAIVKAVDKMVAIESDINTTKSYIPKNKQDIIDYYNEMNSQVNMYTIDKFNKATDKVGEWLEKQDNIDNAMKQLFNNEVPELKEQLDILKLGHYTTKQFLSSLQLIAKESKKKQAEKREKEEQVVVNGQVKSKAEAEKAKAKVAEAKAATSSNTAANTPSSTGQGNGTTTSAPESTAKPLVTPINPSSFVPVSEEEVKGSIERVNTAQEQLIADMEESLKPKTNDENAFSIGLSVSTKLINTNKQLFDDAIGHEVNDEEVQKLISIVEEKLEEEGISENIRRATAINSIKQALNLYSRAIKRRDATKSEKLKALASQLATKTKITISDDGMNATTSTMSDNEVNDVIESFIEQYIDSLGIIRFDNVPVTININKLFNKLITDESLSVEETMAIYNNIADYILNPNSKKYVFSGLKHFNKFRKNPALFLESLKEHRLEIENMDDYLHINPPSSITDEQINLIYGLSSDTPISVEFNAKNNGELDKGAIIFKVNGEEIGIIGTVDISEDGTKMFLRNQRSGLFQSVDEKGNTNFDELFEGIFEGATKEDAELKELLDKYNAFILGARKGETFDISAEEIVSVLKHSKIKEAIDRGRELYLHRVKKHNFNTDEYNPEIELLLQEPVIQFDGTRFVPKGHYNLEESTVDTFNWADNMVTDRNRAIAVLNMLNGVVHHDSWAETTEELKESYEIWTESLRRNYEHTRQLENELEDGGKHQINLVHRNSRKHTIGNLRLGEETGIADEKLHFTYDNNHIVYVENGNVIDEQRGVITSGTPFRTGSMGFVIGGTETNPIIAPFTGSNNISVSPQVETALRNELTKLFTDFQNGELNFEELAERLGKLYSGAGFGQGNPFYGFSIVHTSDDIAIAINDKEHKGNYVAIIHKYKKDTNELGTGITYIENADTTKAKSSIKADKSFIDALVNELIDNTKFNQNAYSVKNRNIDNEKSNPYFYKENGKLVFEIGGVKQVYENFGHFALANNAFTTNQDVNKFGGYFDEDADVANIYLNVNSLHSPVEGQHSVAELITDTDDTNGNNTEDLLKVAGLTQSQIDLLVGKNAANLSLVPNKYYYKNALGKSAYYKNGKIFFTKRGAKEVTGSSKTLVRLLMHEQLHARIDEQNLFDRENIVDELIETYDSLIDAINKDLADKTSPDYKDAVVIKQWLDNNKFNIKDYFTTSAYSRKKLNDSQKARIFAEEWLVESLTQKVLTNYLNKKNFNNTEINIDGITQEKKSILQKIVDIILKLFNINNGNIENNSILARQYQILSDSLTEDNNNETTTENTVEETNTEETETVENTNTEETVEDDNTEQLEDNADEQLKEAFGDNPFGDEQEEDVFNDDDDSMFATTSDIENFDEVAINNYRKDSTNNPFGLSHVRQMNDFVDMFDEQDKPEIANLIKQMAIKYSCR